MPLHVLAVASELYPLVKTGGLADVAGALPGALAAEGVAVRTLVPGYPGVMAALDDAAIVHEFTGQDCVTLADGPARLLSGHAGGLDVFVLDVPHLYARPGNPYLGGDGHDWPDNGLRFAALSQVGARLATRLLAGYQPDVVHAHDWQAGLLPAYLAYGGRRAPPCVLTIHNLSFPGLFPASKLARFGLPLVAYSIQGVEYYGQISFLKAGLHFADAITTVSPTYAVEIRGPEAGMGFDGLLRARGDRLHGILNGIDTAIWNPAHDAALAAPYDAADPSPRALSRAALQARMGLDADSSALLFGVISRLTGQKGLDLLLEALPALLATGAQLAVLGNGDPVIEAGFRTAVAANPGRVACFIGYDEGLAHLLQGGVDALLVPSRFEPCGLTQLCALRYGAVPVVARVGGLADTVIDANAAAMARGVATGIQFAPVTAVALTAAIERTAALHADRAAWRAIQRNGMAADVSWAGPARQYAALFRSLTGAA